MAKPVVEVTELAEGEMAKEVEAKAVVEGAEATEDAAHNPGNLRHMCKLSTLNQDLRHRNHRLTNICMLEAPPDRKWKGWGVAESVGLAGMSRRVASALAAARRSGPHGRTTGKSCADLHEGS